MIRNTIISILALALWGSAPAIAKHDEEKKANTKHHKEKSLPPGLQKKIERGGELPPGWKKKIAEGQIIDSELYRRARILSPVDVHGQEIIRLDDTTMRVMRATGEILHIFGQE